MPLKETQAGPCGRFGVYGMQGFGFRTAQGFVLHRSPKRLTRRKSHAQARRLLFNQLPDCIFELERVRDGGAAFQRYLVIRKVRNHPEKTGVHRMTLTKEGLGIE